MLIFFTKNNPWNLSRLTGCLKLEGGYLGVGLKALGREFGKTEITLGSDHFHMAVVDHCHERVEVAIGRYHRPSLIVLLELQPHCFTVGELD